jgi:PHD/YefM family antitoxin component YafN of YafNO toxin-antitoxin module
VTSREPSLTATIAPAIQQALAALLTAWAEIGTQEIVIHLGGAPVAVLIPYAEYQILQREDILTDLRDGVEAEQVYQEWLADPLPHALQRSARRDGLRRVAR